MFYTYVLYTEQYNKIYIGFTSNLDQRLEIHNSITNDGWTRKYQPWLIAYFETYELKQVAMKREKQLKTSRGRSFIKSRIKEKFN